MFTHNSLTHYYENYWDGKTGSAHIYETVFINADEECCNEIDRLDTEQANASHKHCNFFFSVEQKTLEVNI